jgi:hypothetical protein
MAGAEEFIRRIDKLSGEVGTGNITAGCTVDQIYAQNQHQNLTFHHNVGRAHFLGGPLMENSTTTMMRIARSIIDASGSHLTRAMIQTAEDMAKYVLMNAPRDPDIGDVLANSGSPWVVDGATSVYRRPPVQPREVEDHE